MYNYRNGKLNRAIASALDTLDTCANDEHARAYMDGCPENMTPEDAEAIAEHLDEHNPDAAQAVRAATAMGTETKATVSIYTMRWGWQKCEVGTDDAGNFRLYPIHGVTLAEWREDKSLTPPWLIIGDCDARQWKAIEAKARD
jgi:hypothetical protein